MSVSHTRVALVGVIGVMALATLACGRTSINQLLADPAKYRNQEVTVRGEVTESVSVLGKGVFRLTDGGQSLWVFTRSGAPRKGAHVDVTGRLQDGFDLSAFASLIKLPDDLKSGLVLVESSHQARD